MWLTWYIVLYKRLAHLTLPRLFFIFFKYLFLILGKICFAQTVPSKRTPKDFKRGQSKLFVTFRPAENIKDEVSVTSGYSYKPSSVNAKSGKSNYSFFSQELFGWLLDQKEEKNFIKLMKRATNLVVTANTATGLQTADHYSMMGFTKSYNTAKKSCS